MRAASSFLLAALLVAGCARYGYRAAPGNPVADGVSDRPRPVESATDRRPGHDLRALDGKASTPDHKKPGDVFRLRDARLVDRRADLDLVSCASWSNWTCTAPNNLGCDAACGSHFALQCRVGMVSVYCLFTIDGIQVGNTNQGNGAITCNTCQQGFKDGWAKAFPQPDLGAPP